MEPETRILLALFVIYAAVFIGGALVFLVGLELLIDEVLANGRRRRRRGAS